MDKIERWVITETWGSAEAFYICQSAWDMVTCKLSYSDENKRVREIDCHGIRDVQSNKSIFIILKK